MRCAATIPPVARQTNLPHPRRGARTRRSQIGRAQRSDCGTESEFIQAFAGDLWSQNVPLERRTILAPLQGAVRFRRRSGGIANAQPPANVWQPFRLPGRLKAAPGTAAFLPPNHELASLSRSERAFELSEAFQRLAYRQDAPWREIPEAIAYFEKMGCALPKTS